MSVEQLSENVWFVLFAYMAAFLPWSFLSATDFISPRWKTVRDTRIAGMYNAAFSIIPAAYIVAYLVIQGISNDYKEMCAALVALIFSLLNLLRTVWGLWQLHCFREWAINSISSLKAMGVPYHVKRASGSNHVTDLADSLLVNDTIVDNQLAHGEARCFLSYGNLVLDGGADNEPPIARYLRVAIYGFRIMASLIIHYARTILVEDPPPKLKMTPFKPKEVWLNWSVAFAAQGLGEWIQDFSVSLDPRDDPTYHSLTSKERWEKRAQFFGLQLVSSAWLQLWSEIALFEGSSTVSPFHWCDVWDENDTCAIDGVIVKKEILRSAMKCGTALPFSASDEGKDEAQAGYHAYRRKLLQIVNDLPVRDEFDEMIEEFDIEKLEWLTVLLYIGTVAVDKARERSTEKIYNASESESGSTTRQLKDTETKSESGKARDYNNDEEMKMSQAIVNLRTQLYLPQSLVRSAREGTELGGASQLFQCISIGIPQLSEVFLSERNRHISKIGEMIDAWFSLVCGDQMKFITELNGSCFWGDVCCQGSVSGTDHENSGMFCSDLSNAVQRIHAEVEKRRIYYNFANDANWFESCDQFVTFMGYGMEIVRSRLGSWVVKNAIEDGSRDVFCPLIAELDVVNLELGRGLSDALPCDLKAYNLRHLGVQVRLLWELQQALAKYENDGPESASSIMLCVLSYPSVCIEVEEGYMEPVNSETVDGSALFNFCVCVKDETRLDCMEKGNHKHGRNRDLPRMKIYAECGPQRVELMGTFSERNGTLSVTLQLRGSEDATRFEWVVWRDAFLGRLQGLKEWQEEHGIESANLHLTNGEMRAEVGTKHTGMEEIVYWPGWKPFRFEIMRFELESEGLLKEQFEAEEKTADHVFGMIEDVPWERRKNRRRELLALQGEYSLYSWLGSFPCMRVTAVGYMDGSAVALRHAFLRVEEAFFGDDSYGDEKDDKNRSELMLKDAEKCLDGGDWERAVSLFETVATIDGNEKALDRCVLVLIEQSNKRIAALRVVSLLERFVAQVYAARGQREYLVSKETIYADKVRKYVFPQCLRAMELSGDESLVPRRLSKLMAHVWMIDQVSLREQTLFALQTLYSISGDVSVLETLSRVAHDDYSSRNMDKGLQRNIEMIAEENGNMTERSKTVRQDLVMDSFNVCKRFTGEVVKRQDDSTSPASVLLATLNALDESSIEEDFRNAVAVYRKTIEEGKDDVGMFASWATVLIENEERYTRNEGQITEISQHVIQRNDGKMLNSIGNVLSFRDDKAMCSTTAADLYRRSVEHDDVNAMNSLALLLVNGAEGVERDIEKAEGLYRRAVERDHTRAILNLALLLEEGAEGVARNTEEAERLYRRAVERGDPGAMNNLALLLVNGEGVKRDTKEAEQLFRRAVDNGYVGAMTNLALLLENGSEEVERNPKEAEELYRRAIEHGCVGAMNSLAWLLEEGTDGVARNPKEAEVLYRRAIEQGDVHAMNNLGLLLQQGTDGVRRNTKESEQLYRRAIEQDDVDALYNLGVLLEEGTEEVPRDAGEAERLFRRAVERGDVGAMNNLAVLLEHGAEGVVRNVAEAETLYRRAAELGHLGAGENLASLLVEGPEGGERDGEMVRN